MDNIVLSNSGIGTLQTCPWMYHLKYERNLEQMDKPLYYKVGSAFHLGVEAKRQGKTITQAIKTAIDVFDDVDNKAVVTAMLKEWNNRSSAFYKKYKVVDIEMEIKLHLATIEDGEIYFAGAIDALLEDDQGRLFIGENKTTSDTMDRFTSRLWAQRQGLLYNWALRQRILFLQQQGHVVSSVLPS